MDLGLAGRLAAVNGPPDLGALVKGANNPATARKVAQQFGALLMENVMRQGDGTALPMVGGAGGSVVNAMFAGTVSRAVMGHEKLGLTDLLLHSIEKKQQQASGNAAAGTTATPAEAQTAAIGRSLPLAAYWQANGMRPLAAAITTAAAAAAATPPVRTVMALMPQMNPKLALAFGAATGTGAGTAQAPPRSTTFEANAGHAPGGASSDDVTAFAQKVMPLLQEAGRQLGVSPKILLAQAAIETGWGRSVVGNNLFGIKAGASWSGAKVDAATHEYENGQMVSIRDAFRAYPDAEASVRDFVALVSSSPRYKAALGAGEDVVGYAQGLLAGGWATDIDYVHKLLSVARGAVMAAATGAALKLPPAPPQPADNTVATGGPTPLLPPVSLLPASLTTASR